MDKLDSQPKVAGYPSNEKPPSKKIMLVEDEALIAMAEQKTLEKYGYQVLSVYSGEKAVEAVARESKIDLILMDINLGKGIDGTEAAEIILKDYDLPLIFLSSHTEREVVEKTEGITSYGYIVKNSGETVLIASIKMAFRLCEARQQGKEKEKDLWESEQRFNRMLNVVPDMISIHDTNMNILYSNWQGFGEVPSEKRRTGTKCYKTYRNYEDICPDCLAKEVFRTRTLMKREANLPDGRWVDLRVIPLLNSEGNVEMFMEWVRDITARKNSEQQVLRDKERLRRLVDILQYQADTPQQFLDKALNEAVQITGSTIGYIFFYNEKRKMFSLNTWSENVPGKCEVQSWQREYALEETGVWGDVVRKRGPIIIDDFQSLRSGKKRYPTGHIEIHNFLSIPIFSGGEEIVAAVGVANKEGKYEQTDAMQLALLFDPVWKSMEIMEKEEALRKSEERLSLAMEAVTDGVWDWNLETDSIYWSPQSYLMLGYEPDEFSVTSKVWRDMVHREDRDAAWNTIEQNLSEHGAQFHIKFRYSTKEGGWKWILGQGKPVAWDPSGKVTRMVGIHIDISEGEA